MNIIKMKATIYCFIKIKSIVLALQVMIQFVNKIYMLDIIYVK